MFDKCAGESGEDWRSCGIEAEWARVLDPHRSKFKSSLYCSVAVFSLGSHMISHLIFFTCTMRIFWASVLRVSNEIKQWHIVHVLAMMHEWNAVVLETALVAGPPKNSSLNWYSSGISGFFFLNSFFIYQNYFWIVSLLLFPSSSSYYHYHQLLLVWKFHDLVSFKSTQ